MRYTKRTVGESREKPKGNLQGEEKLDITERPSNPREKGADFLIVV